jgi:glycosyltransferase involved in cell wall biosynthesis
VSRVAIFLHNDPTFDSRVRRQAAFLAADGHQVTLVSTAPHEPQSDYAAVTVPERHLWYRGHKQWLLLRDRPWALARQSLRRGEAKHAVAGIALLPWAAVRAVRSWLPIPGRSVGNGRASGIRWLVDWHDRVLGWAPVAAKAAPPADVYLGNDVDGLVAAIIARGQHEQGRTIYDCHDLLLVQSSNTERPEWSRRLMGKLQAAAIEAADATVTVSGTMAAELRELGADNPVVVRNCPIRWEPAPGDRDKLRSAIGVDEQTPVIVHHGVLGAQRGIEQLVELIDRPLLHDAHLVLLGYGSQVPYIKEAASLNPRIHYLPAVPPEELCAWLSGADLGVALYAPIPNYRVTLPNKLFEWLMAGVPMVVSDFAPWREIVCDDPDGPFGDVVDPLDLDRAAVVVREQLDRSRSGPELRERCRRAAMERLNAETEIQGLLRLVRDVATRRS